MPAAKAKRAKPIRLSCWSRDPITRRQPGVEMPLISSRCVTSDPPGRARTLQVIRRAPAGSGRSILNSRPGS